MKKIIIAGGTGFIGQSLQKKFEKESYKIIIVSRQKGFINWDDSAAIIDALEGADMLINLAGRSVDCRYSEKNKRDILLSRTATTKLLGDAIGRCTIPPKLWINAGTATIYRHAEDHPMTEAGGEIGSGFSVEVAKAWEQSFYQFRFTNTRQALLRIAITLGKDEGVMKPLKNLVRFGLGGRQGSGDQMFSWIHIDDLYGIILFIKEQRKLCGTFNCSSPNPVTNKMLMQELRKHMKVSIGLPSPKWLLKLGAILIQTETELVLKSRWVLPERLSNEGYKFLFPTIDGAFHDLVG